MGGSSRMPGPREPATTRRRSARTEPHGFIRRRRRKRCNDRDPARGATARFRRRPEACAHLRTARRAGSSRCSRMRTRRRARAPVPGVRDSRDSAERDRLPILDRAASRACGRSGAPGPAAGPARAARRAAATPSASTRGSRCCSARGLAGRVFEQIAALAHSRPRAGARLASCRRGAAACRSAPRSRPPRSRIRLPRVGAPALAIRRISRAEPRLAADRNRPRHAHAPRVTGQEPGRPPPLVPAAGRVVLGGRDVSGGALGL